MERPGSRSTSRKPAVPSGAARWTGRSRFRAKRAFGRRAAQSPWWVPRLRPGRRQATPRRTRGGRTPTGRRDHGTASRSCDSRSARLETYHVSRHPGRVRRDGEYARLSGSKPSRPRYRRPDRPATCAVSRRRDDIVIVPVDQIAAIVADGEILHITTVALERHTIPYRLKDLEARLDPSRFVRLSRGTLVSVDLEALPLVQR